MNYGEIKNCDIANGIGVRVSLFVSGCTHHCKGCFNPETWDFNYGKVYTQETEDYLVKLLSENYIEGLSLLGGEPMEKENQKEILPLCRRVKNELKNKTIWCYTGYTFEKDILRQAESDNVTKELISLIDVMVDGEFVLSKKNISLRFRGSENQRIIDVKKSLEENKTVLWNE